MITFTRKRKVPLRIYRLLIIKNWLRLFICIWVKKCVFDDVKFHFLASVSLTFYRRLIFVTCLLPRTAHILITSCMSWRRCLRNLLQNVKITYDLSCVSSHLMEFEAQAKWSHFEMGITNFCYLSLQMLSCCLICFFLSFWCDHEKSCWWFTIKITKVHFISIFVINTTQISLSEYVLGC